MVGKITKMKLGSRLKIEHQKTSFWFQDWEHKEAGSFDLYFTVS